MRAANELAEAPRGLMLLWRIRFIIKDSITNSFVQMLEYPSADERISATPS
jgi:hypothetical protein